MEYNSVNVSQRSNKILHQTSKKTQHLIKMQMEDDIPLGMSKCLNHNMFPSSNLLFHDIDTCNCLNPTFFLQFPKKNRSNKENRIQ